MTFLTGLVIGLIVGGAAGISVMSLACMSKISEMEAYRMYREEYE